MDGRTDSPCVLQDFVPFGAAALLPLNLNHILLKQGTGTAVHLLPFSCYFSFFYFEVQKAALEVASTAVSFWARSSLERSAGQHEDEKERNFNDASTRPFLTEVTF